MSASHDKKYTAQEVLNKVFNEETNSLDTGILSGFNLPEYDYVSMALSAADTTETYTFKTGGSSGTTVATVTVVYTDSTREVLSSVTKS